MDKLIALGAFLTFYALLLWIGGMVARSLPLCGHEEGKDEQV